MYESFDDYLEYLESHRDQIPKDVYDFIIDPRRHTLDDPGSLHDSWLESLSISEHRNSPSTATLTLRLLGQQHDRYLILTYSDIVTYNITGDRTPFYAATYHGDVLYHEIRVSDDSKLTHEIEFATESSFIVTCNHLSFEEKLIEQSR